MTSPPQKWTAIVLAGQRPGTDPLASAFGETFKALVHVAGKPMVARVVETLLGVPAIGQIVILAQQPGIMLAALPKDDRIVVAASGSGISSSIQTVAGTDTAPWPVFVTTADHPLLTREMVEHFFGLADETDVAVGMVERSVVLSAYPDNKRTWLKFRDGQWSGANLFALRTSKALAALDLWAGVEKDRKTAWKLFLHFGPWLALRALTRTIGLGDGLARAGKRLGLSAKLVPLPFAEAAIDVDKLTDHALVDAILKRGRAG